MTVRLKLGSFTFKNTEIPESIPFGGDQELVVHRLVGGKRVIDSMGRTERPLEWSGVFFGGNALSRARKLDAMRVAGKELDLTWDELSYKVVIKSFLPDYRFKYNIPYKITCEVVKDNATPVLSGELSFVQSLINGDITDLDSLIGAIGNDSLTSAYQSVTNALDKVENYAHIARSSIANINHAIYGVAQNLTGIIAGYEATLAQTTSGAKKNSIQSSAAMMAQLVAALEAQARIGRVSRNINQIGSSARQITVSQGDLYSIAAQEYGNAMDWTVIAQANGLTDPKITGITTLNIPPLTTHSTGILNA